MPDSSVLATAWRVFWRGLSKPLFTRVGAVWATLIIIYQVFHYAIALDLRSRQLVAQTPLEHAITWVVLLALWALFSLSSLRVFLYTRRHTLLWLWRQPLKRWHWSVLVCSLALVWNAPLCIPALLVRDRATPAVLATIAMCAAPFGVACAARGWTRWLYLTAICVVVGAAAWAGQWHRELWWASAVVLVPASFIATGRLYERLRGRSEPGVSWSLGKRGRTWWSQSAVSALVWRDLVLSWRIQPGSFGLVAATWLPCVGLSFAMWRHGHELDFMAWLTAVFSSVPMAHMGKMLRERTGDGVFYSGTWGIRVRQRFLAWQGMICAPMVLYVASMMPLWWQKPHVFSLRTWAVLPILQLALGSVHGVAMCASSDRTTIRIMFVLLALALAGWSLNIWSIGLCVGVTILASHMCMRRLKDVRDGT